MVLYSRDNVRLVMIVNILVCAGYRARHLLHMNPFLLYIDPKRLKSNGSHFTDGN